MMSLQLHCNCGWTSQVSEFYLGDRVSCPDCGCKLNVHQQSGVPYGYAPYPTWQKKVAPPLRAARHRSYPLFERTNPHSGPAFWLGMFSMFFVFTGCGAIPGALLALFGINSWSQSRQFAKAHKQVHEGRATVGLGFSVLSLLLCAGLAYSMFGNTAGQHRTHCRQAPPQIVEPTKPHELRYEERDAEWYNRHAERVRAQQAEWKRAQQENGYRYPERAQVTPRTDFQRWQVQRSEEIRKQRAAEAAAKPDYRYGD